MYVKKLGVTRVSDMAGLSAKDLQTKFKPGEIARFKEACNG